MIPKTRIYKISELTRNIKYILENQLPEVWIEGEISNLSISPRGHTYFTIKDETSQIKSVIFKNQRLPEGPKFELKNGLAIYAFGRVTVYERGGNYQVIVSKWEPKGIGALQLAFEELKKKLYSEGLFDEKHKKPLPLFPKRIGVVTSPTGAAVRDIIKTLERRFPGFQLLLHPVRVQGKEAPGEIAEAIEDLNTFDDIDVLIVGRGGGSLEDLWAFNEEIVARAIFNSRIPVISSVGHEIDFTIADFVADIRAATPSIAAEIVIPKKSDFTERIEFLKHKLDTSISSYINDLKVKVNNLASSYVFKEPENTLIQYTQRLDELSHRIKTKIDHILEIKHQQCNNLKSRLNSLNPKSILNRGYSITYCDKTGKIVTEPEELKKGDELKTQVSKGSFKSVFNGKT